MSRLSAIRFRIHNPSELRQYALTCSIKPRIRPWSIDPDRTAKSRFRLFRRAGGIQAKGLLATEAFVSFPFQQKHPLAVTSHFFEFEDSRGQLHETHDLQAGEIYEVIVTTAGGLWRYRLGDQVEVDGWVEATPSLRFLGRGASVSDLCGEKLSECFVTTALHEACVKLAWSPSFAMLAREQPAGEPWRYTLFVEGRAPHDLAAVFESALRQNPHYALCRDLRQLGRLNVCEVREGAAEVYCRTRVEEGLRLGEIKPVHLSLRTDWRARFERG